MRALSDNVLKQPAGDRRFAAFISYSHVDAVAASKLQRKLERYRLPKRIADTRNQGRLLGAIFRDREDLAAAASLGAAIREAIGHADSLVVICSPDAAVSPWVAAEIELFRELHPDRPILAAIWSGEPLASFPSALTAGGLEPLAADLRPEGDGAQLGFLKIVAGIAGVPLDALIQRDAQRRIRRVTAITVGALAAMLIMGVMTTLALQARNEAARQRAEAEGLVEYMLTDLREKLKGVGRLDVMSSVNARAMDHYHRQGNLSNIPADSLERRARVLHAMGEDDEKSGNLPQALAKFREAHRNTSALLDREPHNPDRIYAHAQSEYWVGYAALLNGDIKLAERQASLYRQYAEQLAAMPGDPVVKQKELGWAANFAGVVYLYGRNDSTNALREFKRYRSIFEKIVNRDPSDSEAMRSLSMSYALVAEAYQAGNNREAAIESRKREQAIVDQLYRSDPNNSEIWMLGVIKNRSIARILVAKKDVRNAQRYLAQAEEWSGKLAVLDPENAEWRMQQALNLTVRVALERTRNTVSGLQASKQALRQLRNDKRFLSSLRPQDSRYFISEADQALETINSARK